MKTTFLSISVFVLTSFTSSIAEAADTVRLCTYNVLKYSVANEDGRVPHFQRILNTIRPNVIVCQEVDAGDIGPRWITDVLTYGSFASSPFIDGEDTDNMLFYDQLLFDLVDQRRFGTDLRDIAEFRLATKRTDGTDQDTIVIYSVHLKASDGGENAAQRGAEMLTLLQNVRSHPYAVIAGDWNIYGTSEPAYRHATASDTLRRFIDPLGSSWRRNIASDARFYTQSTRNALAGCGGGVGGGLDDRFDLIVVSEQLFQRTIVSTYTHFGNDGIPRLNNELDDPENTVIDADMVAALKCASDHLPVYVDVILGDVQASVSDPSSGSWLRPNGTSWLVQSSVPHSPWSITDVRGITVASGHTTTEWTPIDMESIPHGVYGVTVGSQRAVVVR